MKTLLATTAIALMAGGPLLAQQVQPEGAQPEEMQQQQDAPLAADQPMQDGAMMAGDGMFVHGQAGILHASELIGMDVHSSDAAYGTYEGGQVASAERAQWDAIGRVDDILLSQDGQVQGILVDIGGFLGIGAHSVAIDMNQVNFLTDETGVHFAAINATRETLEAAPQYERQDAWAAGQMPPEAGVDPVAGAPQPGVAQEPGMAQEPAVAQQPGVAEQPGVAGAPQQPGAAQPGMMTRPTFTREGYQDVDYAQLTAEDLQGATIYDPNDTTVGSISELVLAEDGRIDFAVVDIGGFLGIGAHSVALDFDELQILRSGDGMGDVWIYIDQTREALEQRPAYEG